MHTKTLIAKLNEKGLVFPTCLQWTGADVDARIRAIGRADELPLMDNADKMMLLNEFFDEYEDIICEFINQKLEEHLDHLTHNNLDTQLF